MPRGQYPRKTAGQADAASISTGLVQMEVQALSSQKWFGKLANGEQAKVKTEGAALAEAMLNVGRSRLAVGQHLDAARVVLEPHGLFQKFLRFYGFNLSTAYNHINAWKNSMSHLPEPVVRVAMARGINILGASDDKPLGIYTDAVKQLPASGIQTEEQAATYLSQLEDVRKKLRKEHPPTFEIVPSDAKLVTKSCFKYVVRELKRIEHGSTRLSVLHSIVGMLMKEFDISSQKFVQKPIPADYTVARGRPKTAEIPQAA